MKSELDCRRVERTAGCVALKGDYALNHGFYVSGEPKKA